MSAKEDSKLPKLPKEFPHIFTGVIFVLLPEANYDDLVYLSHIVKTKQRVLLYEPLNDALIKIQIAKLAGLEASSIEKYIADHMEEGSIVYDPLGQAEHIKAISQFIVYAKASLDSMAVFLTGLLSIPVKRESERDFKHKNFRKQVMQKDTILGERVNSLKQWFIDLQNIRDAWIHWTSPRIVQIIESTEVGLLPIPKKILKDFKLLDTPVTKEYYWSTSEFINLHFSNLISFFNLIARRSIEVEISDMEMPPPRPEHAEYPISAFPFRVVQDKMIKEIRLGPRTQSLLGGYRQ